MTGTEFVKHIEAHRNEFYRYVLRNVWNADVADDVFSSAVYAAFKGLDKFRDGTNFRAWMFKILTNKCFVANRETRRLSIDIDSLDESALSANTGVQQHAFENPEAFLDLCGDEVQRAFRQLSTAQRSCLLLLAFERYSYKEIAEILDIPVGTVMTHLSRGRVRLRRILCEYAAEQGIVRNNISSAAQARKVR